MRVAVLLCCVAILSAADAPWWSTAVGLDRVAKDLPAPRATVVVAVIDTGIALGHPALRGSIWTNAAEANGAAGADDDGNGYIDDLHGWNLLGRMRYARYEVVRVQAALSAQRQRRPLTKAESEELAAAERRIAELRTQAERNASQAANRFELFRGDLARVRAAGMVEDSAAAIAAFQTSDREAARSRDMVLDTLAGEAPSVVVKRMQAAIDAAAIELNKHLNPWLDEDDPAKHPAGDNRVDCPGDAGHGTAVAGCVLAVAPMATIMPIRAIPDGDERDADVAEAVRYAVSNGARIINCSFAKDWSPQRRLVDAAFAEAAAKGVLVVRSAGNDGEDNDRRPSFPEPRPMGGPRWENWLVVGASTAKAGRIVADFSNFGGDNVDLFAPGEDLAVLTEDGGSEIEEGTSFAAPLVAGTAAAIWARWPDLSAIQVRQAIIAGVRIPAQDALRPGTRTTRSPLARLCRSGGLLDVAASLDHAATLASRREPARTLP